MRALLLVVGLVAAAPAGDDIPPPRPVDVAALVRQLGSDDFAEREMATQRLSAMVIDPPPELLAATRSENPEIRNRASNAASAMRWNVGATRLTRGQKFAEQGRVDLFVAATAVWDLKPDDDRLWEPARHLGHRLLEKTEMLAFRTHPNIRRTIQDCPAAWPDVATYKKYCKPRFTRVDDLYVCPDPQQENPPLLFRNEAIHAAGVMSPMGIHGGIIVSRGSVETEYAIQTSVIFANGDVTAVTGLYQVVIVCDGDVNLTRDNVGGAVIIARGNITVNDGAHDAELIAGGKVTLGKKPELFRTDIERKRTWKNVVIKENETNPLGFITFFELGHIGLEVKTAGMAMQVAKVEAGKVCNMAGVQVGDIILEVNGKKPTDAESLRRLLRDALAIGDATLMLKRGDKTETVKVALPE
jgi:PDZ domain